MGTRSNYRVIDRYTQEGKTYNNKLVNIYVQYDGYPDGHPLDTAKWLATGKVVNGLGSEDKDKTIFNGAGCLAAQLVARLKDGPGNTYINSMSSWGKCWEDYLYDIIVIEEKTINIVAYENSKPKKKIFEGTPEEYIENFENLKWKFDFLNYLYYICITIIHDVYYYKENNGDYTITIDRHKFKTSIKSENGIAYLCENVENDLYEIDYKLYIKLTDELVPLGLIIDVYKDNYENYIRSFSYMFDEYLL